MTNLPDSVKESLELQCSITDFLRGVYGLCDSDILTAEEAVDMCESVVEHVLDEYKATHPICTHSTCRVNRID